MSSITVPDSADTRVRAAQIINAGGVIAFRTDTFYGLGADPFNPEALRRLNNLKGRDAGKPILVVISEAFEAKRFITYRSPHFNLVSGRHWPGALTIVVQAKSEVPDELTAGSATIGLRLPDDDAVRAFVRACGGALTATSANIAGEPPARIAEEVERSFPEGLDLIVNGGVAVGGKPSTVLSLTDQNIRLIREGSVPRSVLSDTLAELGLKI